MDEIEKLHRLTELITGEKVENNLGLNMRELLHKLRTITEGMTNGGEHLHPQQ